METNYLGSLLALTIEFLEFLIKEYEYGVIDKELFIQYSKLKIEFLRLLIIKEPEYNKDRITEILEKYENALT